MEIVRAERVFRASGKQPDIRQSPKSSAVWSGSG
jgi:hypothetical protein